MNPRNRIKFLGSCLTPNSKYVHFRARDLSPCSRITRDFRAAALIAVCCAYRTVTVVYQQPLSRNANKTLKTARPIVSHYIA